MSVKIINVLKDDTFDEILELFRQSSAAEVILVLPRVGKLFKHEDHFAAFASEAQQGGKTVSVLTANPQTALLARRFGFTVMASGSSKTVRKPATKATLTTASPPVDFSVPDFDDDANLGDVPLTSDQTQGEEPEDAEDADPLRGMHVEDDEGNPVDADEDGKPDEPDEKDLTVGDDAASFVSADTSGAIAAFAAAPKNQKRVPQAGTVDGIRLGNTPRSLTPTAKSARPAPVPVQKQTLSADTDLDYIDTVWRNKNGNMPPPNVSMPTMPSFLSRSWTGASRLATLGSMPKRVAALMVVSAVIVLAGVVYLMTGTARVLLTPVGKTVDTEITVQASDVFSSVDDAFAKLPGQLIEVSKTAESTVAATGKRDIASKARGKITVYNEYSSTPQTLVATTRFESADGKIFRTLQNITVPGSTISAGKTVAGKITVDVIADGPGPSFNISAGNFVIMAFREKGDTEKAKKFYGVSEAAMTGGASGPSAVVTQEDYDKAYTAATDAVRTQIATALESQGTDFVVLDADKPVFSDVKHSARVDDAAASVTVTVTGSLTTVAFRAKDLNGLIASTILKKERLVVLPGQLTLSYSDIAFKRDLGTLVFTVTIKGTGYQPVDEDAIKRDIAGKNSARIRDYFRDREGVQSAVVEMSPFWVRSVPQHTDKISIELRYGTPQEEAR